MGRIAPRRHVGAASWMRDDTIIRVYGQGRVVTCYPGEYITESMSSMLPNNCGNCAFYKYCSSVVVLVCVKDNCTYKWLLPASPSRYAVTVRLKEADAYSIRGLNRRVFNDLLFTTMVFTGNLLAIYHQYLVYTYILHNVSAVILKYLLLERDTGERLLSYIGLEEHGVFAVPKLGHESIIEPNEYAELVNLVKTLSNEEKLYVCYRFVLDYGTRKYESILKNRRKHTIEGYVEAFHRALQALSNYLSTLM